MPDAPYDWTADATSASTAARTGPTGLQARRPLLLATFNKLGRDEALAVVRPCFAVERWSVAVVDARPHADLEALLEVARRAAEPLTLPELELALATYLGVRTDGWPPAGSSAAQHDEASAAQLHEQLLADSRRYLLRFGRPFVARTAGRSTSTLAAQLRLRLGHDQAAELRSTAAALRQIGLLALVRRVSG